MEQGSTGWHGPERRTNVRLRAIIAELQAGVRDHRGAIETLTERVADIAKDVESLKKPRG